MFFCSFYENYCEVRNFQMWDITSTTNFHSIDVGHVYSM